MSSRAAYANVKDDGSGVSFASATSTVAAEATRQGGIMTAKLPVEKVRYEAKIQKGLLQQAIADNALFDATGSKFGCHNSERSL